MPALTYKQGHKENSMLSRVTRSSARLSGSTTDLSTPAHQPPDPPLSSSSSSSRKRKVTPELSSESSKLQESPPSRDGCAKRVKSSRRRGGDTVPRQSKSSDTKLSADATSPSSAWCSHNSMARIDDSTVGSIVSRSVSRHAASRTSISPNTDTIEQLELNDKFKHSPLNLQSREVRLLRLLPRREDEEQVHAIIQHFDLSTVPPFRALSYMWGQDHPLFSVYINGKSFSVRQNLYAFLKTFGSDPEICNDTWLWIDQVCIQQANLDERNHQVRQMAEIYRSASKVIVWLGPGTAYSESLLQCIAEMKENRTSWSESARHVIVQLLGCEYWSRTWVIQEFVLAASMVLCWGTAKFGFDDLEAILKIGGQRIRDRHCQAHSLLQKINQVFELMSQKSGSRHDRFMIRNWKNALTLSSFTNCQDFRDRIYALLGLVDPRIAISPDYAATPDEIFVDVLAGVAVQYANILRDKEERADFLATKALVSRALGLGNRPLDELSDELFFNQLIYDNLLRDKTHRAKAADALRAWVLEDKKHIFGFQASRSRLNKGPKKVQRWL